MGETLGQRYLFVGWAESRQFLSGVALACCCLLAPSSAVSADGQPPAASLAALALATDDQAIPDEPTLLEQLEEAVELRAREDFDRTLDARDPGELVEHATLTEIDFDYRKLGIDTLFIVGDELFAYPFRPENGWGGGAAKERREGTFRPALRRVHHGESGGPDAFSCASCHFKGGPDGAGAQTQNAFLRGDGNSTVGADQRNPPHLLGLGPVALLAQEMTRELQAAAGEAAERATKEGQRVELDLVAKGVAFGKLSIEADGEIDASEVRGIDADLVVRPFGWKGHHATLRGIVEESLHIHQGLVSKRVSFGVRDGKVDPGPYGKGRWDDVDEDGVSLEIDSGMLTTVVGYLAQLEVPVMRPPRDPGLVDAFAAGRADFERIGCTSCHVATLELRDSKFDVREHLDPDRPSFTIDIAVDGEQPKIEPVYAGDNAPFHVHLFSDLKRHDMGASLATPNAQGAIPATEFLTRPLWGLAETAPYLHDGRAPTIHDAIALHGGEATAARDAYLALNEKERGGIRVFLASLSRKPKLFVP